MPVQSDGNWFFNVNFDPTGSYSEYFRAIGDTMAAASWTIKHSSNGTTVVTGSRNSDAQWNLGPVTSSWEEWHDPGGHRALIFQRVNGTVASIHMWLTQTGTLPLTGSGAGSATVVPHAPLTPTSYQATLSLSGAMWATTPVTNGRAYIAFSNTPASGTNFYPFYILGVTKPTSTTGFISCLGAETPEPNLDREPWVHFDAANDSSLGGWYLAGNSSLQSFVAGGLDMVGGATLGLTSPYSTNRYLGPVFAYDTAGTAQVKGRIYDHARTNLTTVSDTVNLSVSGSCFINYSTTGHMYRWPAGTTPNFS